MKARPRVPTRKPEEAVDRRQNNRSDKAMDLYICRYRSMVKAVSRRRCVATRVLRSCCLNCCAEQSQFKRS